MRIAGPDLSEPAAKAVVLIVSNASIRMMTPVQMLFVPLLAEELTAAEFLNTRTFPSVPAFAAETGLSDVSTQPAPVSNVARVVLKSVAGVALANCSAFTTAIRTPTKGE